MLYVVLVGAPTGSGKTVTGELAMLRLLRTRPKAKIVYVAPLKALARERLSDWRKKLGEGCSLPYRSHIPYQHLGSYQHNPSLT